MEQIRFNWVEGQRTVSQQSPNRLHVTAGGRDGVNRVVVVVSHVK